MERIPEFIGNHLFLATLFISLLILLLWNIFGKSLSGIRQISPAEATRLINHEDAVVLDVRGEEDYKNGHILNAIHVPETELESRQKQLEKYKNRVVVVSCGHGGTAARVARALKMNGFEKLYCLKGGIQGWRGDNLPLTRDV